MIIPEQCVEKILELAREHIFAGGHMIDFDEFEHALTANTAEDASGGCTHSCPCHVETCWNYCGYPANTEAETVNFPQVDVSKNLANKMSK